MDRFAIALVGLTGPLGKLAGAVTNTAVTLLGSPVMKHHYCPVKNRIETAG
jgi:hypothetical protein